MGLFIRANRISRYNMKMLSENPRIPMIMCIVFLFIVQNLSSVLLFSKAVNISVTPYAFPFLTNDYICQFVFIAGAVALFCNAPFEDEGYQYMLPRTGRVAWAVGQVIYIFKVSLLYIFELIAATIIPFIGHLQLGTDWGKIWGTLGKTNAGSQYGLNFSVSQYVLSKYSPMSALMVSILLEWACIVWIGLFIYFGNKITNKSLGIIVGAFITLLDVCVANDWVDWAYGFSPVSLAQIKTYSGYALKYGIDLSYGVKFFIVGIVLLIMLCILSNEKDRICRGLNLIKELRRVHIGTGIGSNSAECKKGV